LKGDQEWFRELSWDQSWKNLIGTGGTTKENAISTWLVTQHYIEPEEMFQMYYSQTV
jgi:hypothetical protein